jgi:hypothetical protein
MRKWVKSPGVEISPISVRDVSSFEELLNNSQYDCILVSPGARGKVPHELRQSPGILLVRMQLDSASLEAARVRAGVII